ncbi:MAG: hypothetical protein R6V35_03145 [Candidatus Nanohaloarchaea archaeon]
MLGSMGIRTILSLVLGLMILGTLVSFSTVGSIGGAIEQGFGQIGDQTDFTTEVSSKETFSDLAMFVADRSRNCNDVEERIDGNQLGPDPRSSITGYPGLKGTRLGQKPDCIGADASILRGVGNKVPVVPGSNDNYMPGIYSREKFEIDIDEGDKIVISDDRAPTSGAEDNYNVNDQWIENRIAAVSGNSYQSQIDLDADSHVGSKYNYVVFFEDSTNAQSRTNQLLEEWEDPNGNKIYSDRVWGTNDETNWHLWTDNENNIRFHATDLVLCNGDKGYIQVNHEGLLNDGNYNNKGGTSEFPRIVITETGENCVNEDLDQTEPYEGDVEGPMLEITGDVDEFPNTEKFTLSQSRSSMGAEDASENMCQIKYMQKNPILAPHVVVREYRPGLIIQSDQENFNLDYWREATSYSDRGDDGWDLIDALELNENYINPPSEAGSLRLKNKNEGQNLMYGDLLCAPSEDGSEVNWNLCHSDVDSRDNAEYGAFTYSCNGDNWNLDQTGFTEVTSEPNDIYPNSDFVSPLGSGGYSLNFNDVKDGEFGYMSWEDNLVGGWEAIEVNLEISTIDEGEALMVGEGRISGEPLNLYFRHFDGAKEIVISEPDGSGEVVLDNWETGKEYLVTFSRTNNRVSVREEGDDRDSGEIGYDLSLIDIRVQENNFVEGSSTSIEADINEVMIKP